LGSIRIVTIYSRMILKEYFFRGALIVNTFL
jgi:hypothetical protein